MLSRNLVSDIISHAIVIIYERNKNVLNLNIHYYLLFQANKNRFFLRGAERERYFGLKKRLFVNLSRI